MRRTWPTAQLHWLRAVVMHPDRRVSEMVQYAREIVIPPRTEDELYENVPAEGDADRDPAGARAPQGRQRRPSLSRRRATTRSPASAGPSSSPGDVVEVAFRSWTAGPVGGRGDPPFYRLDYAGALSTHPVLYNEDVIESPPDRPICADVVNGKADRVEDKTENGRHVVRFVWDKPPNVPDEPLAPPLSEVVPTLVMSTFKDWSAFRAWYGEAVQGFTDPDAQVRELAAKLTRGKTTREDKLRALFDFVADDIRYVNYVSGEWWLPNRPQQLLARREGDCDDKALLLITLLKAVGIEAQEVMVQTRHDQPAIHRACAGRGDPALRPRHRVPARTRRRHLPRRDEPPVAPRPLAVDGCARGRAAHGRSGRDRSAAVELARRPRRRRDVDAALAADGSADLEGDERGTGDDAFFMRTYLTEPGARAQWIEDRLVGPWFSDRRGRQEGRLPGRPSARAGRGEMARALGGARAARGGRAGRAAVALAAAWRRSSRRS